MEDSTIEELPTNNYRDIEKSSFIVGDKMYPKPHNRKCDIKCSNVSVEIDEDGIAQHVSFLRLVPGQIRRESKPISEFFEAKERLSNSESSETSIESKRSRKKPEWHKNFIFFPFFGDAPRERVVVFFKI